ncbi:kinesin light chain-like [Paramuricea clavata]|uniref:Kinesin light chain-like n=1 Tax=Paramuricea clavata TaxID=317549 RepID=A0A6S7IHC8_PARCT|nr:kinesin light chain-like [Paramuricea clavata]
MSMQPYSDEELNYFKFASIVLKEFPDALRSIFVDMWDTRVAPSSTVWDDSPLLRNILHNNEAPNTKIPTNNSFKEWDCTALFQATLYARTFALPDSTGKKKTLGEIYLKRRKPVPAPFHSAVRSSSGDANETIALAVDQLRLLRNTLCHTSSPQINKVTFDNYVRHAKDAFTALNFSPISLERIGNLKESDFPTKEVEKLNKEIKRQRNDSYLFLESEVKHEMSEMKYEMSEVKQKLNSIEGVLTQTKDATDQCAATSDSEFKYFNDVLLLTVDNTEFNEAQKILNNDEIPSKKDESDKNCCFGKIGRNKVTLLKVPYFGKTAASSSHDLLVYETIQELKPKAIVSLGVCDGVRKEAHFLGDVVVSSQVYFLEQQDDDLSNFDGTTYDCNLGLVHLFHRGKFAWVGPCENVVVPKVYVGQFTTGLQDDDDENRDSHKAGTIGIDTASKSVHATCRNSGVPWLSCKSIARWANDKCQDSTWCQFGAAVSASYVQHVLKRFYIPDEVQVFDKSVPKPCLPPMVPHFIGRQQECEEILRALTSTSARLVTVSGPPWFWQNFIGNCSRTPT